MAVRAAALGAAVLATCVIAVLRGARAPQDQRDEVAARVIPMSAVHARPSGMATDL